MGGQRAGVRVHGGEAGDVKGQVRTEGGASLASHQPYMPRQAAKKRGVPRLRRTVHALGVAYLVFLDGKGYWSLQQRQGREEQWSLPINGEGSEARPAPAKNEPS